MIIARKRPEFYIIIAREKFFSRRGHLPSLPLISCAYVSNCHLIKYQKQQQQQQQYFSILYLLFSLPCSRLLFHDVLFQTVCYYQICVCSYLLLKVQARLNDAALCVHTLEFVVVVVVVVVVFVVITSPSGNCLYGGTKMSRRDEEFYQTLNPEGSVSPS